VFINDDGELRIVYPEESADSVVVPLDGYLFGRYARMFKLLLTAASAGPRCSIGGWIVANLT
jgi:hypothetical protein